jgi:hypothetical protein
MIPYRRARCGDWTSNSEWGFMPYTPEVKCGTISVPCWQSQEMAATKKQGAQDQKSPRILGFD